MSRDQTELRPGGAPPASQASGDNVRPRSSDRGVSPVPADNRAGHHPDHEQDQPDLDAFVARFNGAARTTTPAEATSESAEATNGAPTAAARPLPPDHGANAGPSAVPPDAGFRLPLLVLHGGARGAGKLLHLGARLIDAVADRLDPPREAD